jgi:hypothetical protein
LCFKDIKKDFILQQSSEQLEEVIIEMPENCALAIQLSYKTDKFTDGSERKLKKCIKKNYQALRLEKWRCNCTRKKSYPNVSRCTFGGNSKLAVKIFLQMQLVL